jgi:hypothetical protein
MAIAPDHTVHAHSKSAPACSLGEFKQTTELFHRILIVNKASTSFKALYTSLYVGIIMKLLDVTFGS